MPIYEYECTECGGVFERWWQTYSRAEEAPACPDCGKPKVRKLFPGTARKLAERRPQAVMPALLERQADETGSVPPPETTDTQLARAIWQIREPTESSDPTEHTLEQALFGTPGWLLVGASLRGKQHAHEAKFREDAFAIASSSGWNIAAVADGAGSATLARVGAPIATRTCVASLTRRLAGLDNIGSAAWTSEPIQNAIESAIRDAQDELAREANRRQVALRELSTTLLVAIHQATAASQRVFAAQVGDGLIAASSPSRGAFILTTPRYGEFANETEFLTGIKATSDITTYISEAREIPLDLRYLVLLTDGVADDFLPAKIRLPKLIEQFPGIMRLGEAAAPQALLALISYNKRGSFDDRTAVVIGSCNQELTER